MWCGAASADNSVLFWALGETASLANKTAILALKLERARARQDGGAAAEAPTLPCLAYT